jgi:hypothetical protein
MSWDSRSSSRDRSSGRDSRSRSRDSQENGRTRTGGARQGHEQNQGQLVRRNRNVDVATDTIESVDSRDVYYGGSAFAGNLRAQRKGMTREESMRAPGIETQHKGVSVVSANVGRHGSASREAALDAVERGFDRNGVGRYNIFTVKEPEYDLHRHRASQCHPHRSQRLKGIEAPAMPVVHCMACGTDGHSARTCVLTTEDGDLDICPFCERHGEHLPEDCPDRQNFDVDDVWDFFVVFRARKSPIRTKAPELAWANIVGERFRLMPVEQPLSAYPHSLAFAKEWYNRVPNRWSSHNYKAGALSLATDKATEALTDVLRDQAELARPFPYTSDGSGVDVPMPDQRDIEGEEVHPGAKSWGVPAAHY